MLKKGSGVLIVLISMSFWSNLSAQTTYDSAPIDPRLKAIELLEQLAGAIDPGAFLNSWTSEEQRKWSSDLSNAQDAASIARNITFLSEFIKPEKYKEQFSLAQLKAITSRAQKYGDVAYAMTMLEEGLAEEAFVNSWVSMESSWKSELTLVK